MKTLLLPLIFIFITPVFADDRERPAKGRFSLSLEGGTSFTVGGEFIRQMSSSSSTTIGSTSLTATLSNDSFDFGDVFKTPEIFGLGFSYGLSESTELFGRLHHIRADAERFTVARFDISGTLGGVAVSAGETLDAKFDDYRELSLTMGVRRYFNRFGSLSPFVSIEGGIAHVDELELDVFTSTSSVRDVSFYSDSWTPKVGVGVGISYKLNKDVSFSVESGLGYEAALNADDEGWGSAYKDVNNAGERWSVPFTFGFKVRW